MLPIDLDQLLTWRLKQTVIGIDEVGRGAWAGPLVAAAVILTKPIDGLTDSKLLSKKRREELAKIIRASSLWAVAEVSVEQLNSMNLHQANLLAMQRASALLKKQVGDYVTIFDGYAPDGDSHFYCKKGDLLIPEISAASIVAKVYRDALMAELAIELPQYGFEKHVGYGTARHLVALQTHGVTIHHRTNFKPVKVLMAQALSHSK